MINLKKLRKTELLALVIKLRNCSNCRHYFTVYPCRDCIDKMFYKWEPQLD